MSKIELDRNNKTLYGQIADILRERIMSGEFKPGDILPSEPENRGIYTQSDSSKKSSRNIWSLAVVSVDQRY